jgi:ankyrin repeat protein
MKQTTTLCTGALVLILCSEPVALCGPIHDAARKGEKTKVAALLDQETPLTLALIPYRHTEMVNLLVSYGADVNVFIPGGVTPLHRAVQGEHIYDVELFLAAGADPNVRGAAGRTPLHLAALAGNAQIAKILLDHGADPNAKDYFGSTPLSYAKTRFHDHAATVIRAHGGR